MHRSTRLSGSGLVSSVLHFSRVSSTQALCRDLVRRGAKPGTVVLADAQDEGRGRFGRRWVSPPGGLYASILLPADPLVSLRAGMGIVSALEEFGVSAALKWPNDVLVRRRKIAGVLIHVVADTAIVGIGVNLIQTPIESATCLAAEGPCAVDKHALLERILESFPHDTPERLLARYAERCSTLGQIVCVKHGGIGPHGVLTGRARGVDALGRLLVEACGSVHAVASGDCTNLVQEGGTNGEQESPDWTLGSSQARVKGEGGDDALSA